MERSVRERPKKVYEKESLKGSRTESLKSVGKSEKEERERTTQCRVERKESLQGSRSGICQKDRNV